MASAARDAAGAATSSAGNVAATLAGIGVIGGVADWIEGDGLDVSRAAASEILRPLFGGQVPWEMTADEIVDAVVPNFLPDVIPGAADEAVTTILPALTDVLLTVM